MVPVEFILLSLCAVGGFGAVSALLVLPVATAGLLMSSMPKYLSLWLWAREVDKVGAWARTMGLVVLNAIIAVSAAYGLGLFMRWVMMTI